MSNKNPWIAGILNSIYGMGYLYNGRRKLIGGLFLLGVILAVGEGAYNDYYGYARTQERFSDWIAGSFYTLGFMYDAYSEAKKRNNLREKTKTKHPLVAAILNLFFGLGYLYNGKRLFFGSLLFCGTLTVMIDTFFIYVSDVPAPSDISLVGLFALALIVFAFVYDAYSEAKEINKKFE
jgi:hypothetical protein